MIIVGNYLVESVVGRGRYGWVSRGRHLKLGLEVAIKHAPWAVGEQCCGGTSHKECEHVKESSWRAALCNEASVLSQISHPAIVSLLEVIKEPLDTIYICLEDLGNTSLSHFVESQGNPGLKEIVARKIIKDISGGLEYLHTFGILHRDIKPDNIMIISLDTISAKLIDMGLATTWAPDKLLNTSDVRAGTVSYMAPELMVENVSYGGQIDIFSLGASLYFSLTGVAPFQEFIRDNIILTTSIYGLQINHEDSLDAMSNVVANLLRLMLNSDPVKRCTLASLCNHPWIK